MTKVTVEEVRARLAANAEHVSIVDSRSADAWNGSYIKARGAIRIPPDEAAKHVADLDRDDYVVTYCT